MNMAFPKCSYCPAGAEKANAGFSTWHGSVVAVCAAHQTPGLHIDANAVVAAANPNPPTGAP